VSDIVERLRSWVYTNSLHATACEAADEIERLRHRVRFADAVIRSGNVATLTEAEQEALGRAVILLAGNANRATVGAVVGLLDRMS
jgi:hypothetical protein